MKNRTGKILKSDEYIKNIYSKIRQSNIPDLTKGGIITGSNYVGNSLSKRISKRQRYKFISDHELRMFCLEQAVMLIQQIKGSGLSRDRISPMQLSELLFTYIKIGEVNDPEILSF